MQNFEKIGKEILGGSKGNQIKDIANSPEGKKISQMFDAGQVENAAKSGDMAALKDILAKVLGSEEGKSLAAKLSDVMDKK